jgi:hypothetical protein
VIDRAPTAPNATFNCMSTGANARRSTIPTGSGPSGTLEHPPAGPRIADSKGYQVTATPTPVRGNCPVITHGNLSDKDSRDILPMQRLPSTLINPSVEQYMIHPKHCCWDIEMYNRTDFSELINTWRISTTPQAVAQAEHKSTRGWIRDTELSIALQKGSDIRLIFRCAGVIARTISAGSSTCSGGDLIHQ